MISRQKIYHKYFNKKKITIMGLGLLGRGVSVARFLSQCGADILITDLKSAHDLKSSLRRLSAYKSIKYVLGKHRLADFCGVDMVIKTAGVPIVSPFIARAKKCKVDVKMDASLFCELAPKDVLLIGITGTRGKSTTSHLIYEILQRFVLESKQYAQSKTRPRVYLGGNIRGMATLPLLKKVRKGDIVVLELDSWQLQGFGDAKISPNIAVFTTFYDDHLNYYNNDRSQYLKDKANIFINQVKTMIMSENQLWGNVGRADYLVLGEQVSPIIEKQYSDDFPRALIARREDVPKMWKIKIPGEHNRYNISCALKVADIIGVERHIIKQAVESFSGLPGRIQYTRSFRGIDIYNDTCATTPEATISGLNALHNYNKRRLSSAKRIVLIMGGADKGLEMSALFSALDKYCSGVVLLEGTGTKKMLNSVDNAYSVHTTLKSAVAKALILARKGDIVLFSPGFASFGMFKNEFDRGDQFTRIIKGLK